MQNVVFKMEGVTKQFPGVLALDKVSFDLTEGEIHGLVGANGAGKSTLIKTLAGVHPPDSGNMELFGNKVSFKSPNDAKLKGVSVIYQEFTLFPDLDVAKNIYFGMEPKIGKTAIINWKLLYRNAELLLKRFDLDLDIYAKVSTLSVAEQQMVEIAKALSCDAKILVMDEPTATLTIQEVEQLFKIILDLKSRNVSIIYISHRLDEIRTITDRITVLRTGQVIGSAQTKGITNDKIIEMMIGAGIDNEIRPNPEINSDVVLEMNNISNASIHDINLQLRQGEVLGIVGLVGAGRTETVRALFGADGIATGTITKNGKELKIQSPKDAINAKIGLLPESRKAQGLFMNLSVMRNMSIANLDKFISGVFINSKTEKQMARGYIDDLSIKTPDENFPVVNLSGGNQQKVALAKWLCMNCDILILDEPTRGVDVGAKEEIFDLVKKLTQAGKSIIFISSELEEVLRVSNRILAMYKGSVTAEIPQHSADINSIMQYITGGKS